MEGRVSQGLPGTGPHTSAAIVITDFPKTSVFLQEACMRQMETGSGFIHSIGQFQWITKTTQFPCFVLLL